MKYTRKERGKYVFTPPSDVVKAGVLKRTVFEDGRAARYEVPRLIKIVKDFRAGKITPGNLTEDSKVRVVFAFYLDSPHFLELSVKSQGAYQRTLDHIMNTGVPGKQLGDIKIKDVKRKHCQHLYDTWLTEVGPNTAQQRKAILSVLFNFAVALELRESNPCSHVKTKSFVTRSVTWKPFEVEKFLKTAFTEYEWRSVGLIVLLCYSWAQRPLDIRNLLWYNVDFENKVVTIEQSKRGATVELPITDELLPVLQKQWEDFGWQKYVIPFYRVTDKSYRPLTSAQQNLQFKQVKAKAELRDDVQIGDLRKTAIVEMRESGVDMMAIMSVSGHKDIKSLNPYNKLTYRSAKSALEKRGEYLEKESNV